MPSNGGKPREPSIGSDRVVLCPSTWEGAEARAWTTTMAALGVEGVLWQHFPVDR